MSNNFISPHNLPLISDYLARRESGIVSLVEKLMLSDLEASLDFEKAKFRIEKEIMLTPVTLGEIELSSHLVEKEMLKSSGNDAVRITHRHTHRISIPFTGDKVLFTCSPVGGIPNQHPNPIVVIPLKDSIIINVELTEYNPELAIETANNNMTHTLSLLERNNKTVMEWNDSVAKIIDKSLREKRAQLQKEDH